MDLNLFISFFKEIKDVAHKIWSPFHNRLSRLSTIRSNTGILFLEKHGELGGSQGLCKADLTGEIPTSF